MQAKLVQLEALGERVSGLAGVQPNELKTLPGRGGALVSGRPLTVEELQATLDDLDQLTPGTPILAAAGGVVVTAEMHPAYGNMVEIDHGNNLVTRYAHASKFWVKKGDLIKRGQKVADVGSTGRSTGPHLHFEVLVQGIPQDPRKFLAAGKDANPAALQQVLAQATQAAQVPVTGQVGVAAAQPQRPLEVPSRR
jgi:hypothetical protein